jgi:hypothetical protein
VRVATIVVLAVIFFFGVWSAIDALSRGESLANAVLAILVAVLAFVTFVTAPDLTTVENDLSEIKQDSAAIRAQLQDQDASANIVATVPSPGSSQENPNKIVGFGLLMVAFFTVGVLIGRRRDVISRESSERSTD